MSFKDLALNQELIEEAIYNYDVNLQVEPSEDKTRYTVFFDGQPKALIIFHFKKSGKTTIQVNQGNNQDLGTLVAKEVVAQCQIAIASKQNFSIKPLTKDSFELLLEYLQEECSSTVEEKNIQHGKLYDVKGIQGDSVKLTYYDNNTFMIQSCPVLLHSQIVEFLSEVLDLEEVVNSQLKLIKTDITVKEALNDLSAYLPNSYGFLDKKLKSILSPSLVLQKLDIELTDYSVFAFPALKGLEGYIKQLFASKKIIIGRDGFAPYLRDSSYATLHDSAREQIDCEKTCTAINQCYGYYKSQRHGLFHANGVIKNTRLIESRTDAVSIITEVLDKIETSYVTLGR